MCLTARRLASNVWRVSEPDEDQQPEGSPLRRQWGKNVKDRRFELGFSQFDVATRAGVQQMTVSRVEKGRLTSDENLIAIARALETPLGDLFPWPDAADVAS